MEILRYGIITLDNILWRRLISESYISLMNIKMLQSDEQPERFATK